MKTPQEIITCKRGGGELGEAEIRDFVQGLVAGTWSRGQTGSFLMACFLNGLSRQETGSLLEEMLHSGEVLSFDGLPMPVADKHSTGGVGDKVSIVLAPLAAACGLAVPMLSGRGLGHTGGTLDKLESIPGFRVFLSPEEIRAQVRKIGCVMAGQTETIVPADRILYAMRDETATVEHPCLVATSILSKKLAEGLQALFLDVKFGRGAFFQEYEDAEGLARLMVELGEAAGCRVAAWLTRMDSPLGRAVGNAVEVEECLQILKGEGPSGLVDFICGQVGAMLHLTGLQPDLETGTTTAREALANGAALARFRQMVAAQGGNTAVIDNPELLPQARFVEDILHEEGKPLWVADVDARKVAEIGLQMGAGRRNADASVDHATGISGLVEVGERVEAGDLLARLHFNQEERGREWTEQLREAIQLTEAPVKVPDLVVKRLTKEDL
jgi:pyrimidine-nucleoside phosphorylase